MDHDLRCCNLVIAEQDHSHSLNPHIPVPSLDLAPYAGVIPEPPAEKHACPVLAGRVILELYILLGLEGAGVLLVRFHLLEELGILGLDVPGSVKGLVCLEG